MSNPTENLCPRCAELLPPMGAAAPTHCPTCGFSLGSTPEDDLNTGDASGNASRGPGGLAPDPWLPKPVAGPLSEAPTPRAPSDTSESAAASLAHALETAPALPEAFPPAQSQGPAFPEFELPAELTGAVSPQKAQQPELPSIPGTVMAAAVFPEASENPAERWYVRNPNGQMYGPIDWRGVDRWYKEGRIGPGAMLAKEGSTIWQAAEKLLRPSEGNPAPSVPASAVGGVSMPAYVPAIPPSPVLSSTSIGRTVPMTQFQPVMGAAQADAQAAAQGLSDPSNPYASPTAQSWQPAAASAPWIGVAPHRGGLVLGLGIGSIFLQLICGLFCGFFSMLFAPPMAVATIVLAFIDLNRMKAGQMDPSGKGITQAGLICAIVSLCIFGLGTLAFIAIFAIGPNGLQF